MNVMRTIAKGMLPPVIILVFSLLAAPSAGAARQIIFPPDNAVIEEAEIDVLGIRRGNPDFIAWGARGEQTKEPLEPGYFAVTVSLVPGRNVITVGDEWVNVFLAADGAGSPPDDFLAPDLHAVDNSCDDCHVDGGSADLVAEGGELCANCHDAVTSGEDGEPLATQHPPAEDGECTSCHVFHGPAMSALSGSAVATLCYECHDDFAEEEGTTLHPVLEDDGCLDCHRPHGSSHGAILAVDSSELCFECHDNPALNGDGEEWASPHPAVDDGCTTCHNPHASKHGTLLVAEISSLCGECHDDKNADDDGNPWRVSHSPVEEGDCVSCHLPHGSGEGALLIAPAPELCGECHDDKNVDADGAAWSTAHPPVEDGECLVCHGVHGSSEAGMLTMSMPELCNECHDDKRFDEGGETWPTPHSPVSEGICMECHAPHGSTEAGLLVIRPVELCTGCHDDLHTNHLEYDGESDKVTIPKDFPVEADGSFDCTGCHVPHGGSEISLWRWDQSTFCVVCHMM